MFSYTDVGHRWRQWGIYRDVDAFVRRLNGCSASSILAPRCMRDGGMRGVRDGHSWKMWFSVYMKSEIWGSAICEYLDICGLWPHLAKGTLAPNTVVFDDSTKTLFLTAGKDSNLGFVLSLCYVCQHVYIYDDRVINSARFQLFSSGACSVYGTIPAGYTIVDRPNRLICISDIYLFIHMLTNDKINRQIQKT